MLNFLFVIGMHLLPLILFLIPFLLIFDVSLKNSPKYPKHTPINSKDIQELEKNLTNLIKENTSDIKIQKLTQELNHGIKKPISSYLNQTKKNLYGYHLFQHIFSLIKNNTKDEKIIKILHTYFPSCATSHLYAMLKSFKTYLKMLQTTPHQKSLINSLNQNNIMPTLYFLEERLSKILTQINTAPTQKDIKELATKATIYSLVFATFSEFYSKELTKNILNLAQKLSPTVFNQWHQTTFHTPTQTPNSTTYSLAKLSPKTSSPHFNKPT